MKTQIEQRIKELTSEITVLWAIVAQKHEEIQKIERTIGELQALLSKTEKESPNGV